MPPPPPSTIIALDLGTTTAKFAVIEFSGDRNGFELEIVDSRILPSSRWKELVASLEPSGKPIITTGYFRKQVKFAVLNVTEITTAKEGVSYFVPDFDVVVDIGGQDIKLYDVRTNDFRLNDKCSAGTGAFFEFVAQYFAVPVESLSRLHFTAERHPTLNSTCTVFALSEMISRLVEGYTREEIIRGLHFAFGEKIAALIPDCEKIALIGGVALNEGVANVLRTITNKDIVVPTNCQFMNAIGAAIYGWKKLDDERR